MTILKTRNPARFVCDLFVMMDADDIEFKPLPLPSFWLFAFFLLEISNGIF